MPEHAIICSQLALERCRQYITHIYAVMYMTEDKQDPVILDSVRKIVSMLDQELGNSQDFLSIAQAAARVNKIPAPGEADMESGAHLSLVHST
jgi:flagellar biosynthesis/type III secretory pathway ATPase